MQRYIAIIGCGWWGKNLVRVFNELGVLSTICDESEAVLKDLSEKYGGVKIARDINDLMRDETIKGVVIAAPAARHYEMAKMAILAGKDVFVEKPLALRYNEGEELARLADVNGRVLMVGHILEYHPAIERLKDLISSGELGEIRYVYSNRLSLGKLRREENVLWSFAPHDISIILSLLGEMPSCVSAHGGNYLKPDIADVTLSWLSFPSGVKAHIFVSWLHPFKEQRLVVVGSKKMAVFDDTSKDNKLVLYPHKAHWEDNIPVIVKAEGEPVKMSGNDPLKQECMHFVDRLKDRNTPRTGSKNGLAVLRVLDQLQESISKGGKVINLDGPDKDYYAHETAVIDDGAVIGEGTKVWHFSHVMSGSKIGKKCSLGQNVIVSPKCVIGNNVKIQNNVSVYTGVYVEDDAFLGPSMVFTNVYNPRSFIERKNEYRDTFIKRGASIGANAVVMCGHTIGEYSFVGAGAVVTKDIPPYALVYGNPGKLHGWVCRCGWKLSVEVDHNGSASCEKCKAEYEISDHKVKMTKKGNYASTSAGS